MIQKYLQTNTNRNFSIAMVWINGGSGLDNEGKKGINKILSSLLSKGCKGFANLEFSEYVDSHGAELNLETLEDGILISLKSLNEYFNKLFPLLELIINKPLLSNSQFLKVKKTTIDLLKKENENPYNVAFEKWRKLVYSKHQYAYNPSGYHKDILSITHDDIISTYWTDSSSTNSNNNNKVSEQLSIENTPVKEKAGISKPLQHVNISDLLTAHKKGNENA